MNPSHRFRRIKDVLYLLFGIGVIAGVVASELGLFG